jgi:hypothetical protein
VIDTLCLRAELKARVVSGDDVGDLVQLGSPMVFSWAREMDSESQDRPAAISIPGHQETSRKDSGGAFPACIVRVMEGLYPFFDQEAVRRKTPWLRSAELLLIIMLGQRMFKP